MPVASVIVDTAMNEATIWLKVQGLLSGTAAPLQLNQGTHIGWEKPPHSFVKCNVGSSWVPSSGVCGTAWLLRDANGKVILHSRRAFSGITSALQADLLAVSWAASAIKDLKIQKVILEYSSPYVGLALANPVDHPLHYQSCHHLLRDIHSMHNCSLQHVPDICNSPALEIAMSVTRDNRSQSYVARHGPIWLASLLSQEAGSSS